MYKNHSGNCQNSVHSCIDDLKREAASGDTIGENQGNVDCDTINNEIHSIQLQMRLGEPNLSALQN